MDIFTRRAYQMKFYEQGKIMQKELGRYLQQFLSYEALNLKLDVFTNFLYKTPNVNIDVVYEDIREISKLTCRFRSIL